MEWTIYIISSSSSSAFKIYVSFYYVFSKEIKWILYNTIILIPWSIRLHRHFYHFEWIHDNSFCYTSTKSSHGVGLSISEAKWMIILKYVANEEEAATYHNCSLISTKHEESFVLFEAHEFRGTFRGFCKNRWNDTFPQRPQSLLSVHFGKAIQNTGVVCL